jgi:hypothetical protein
MSGLWRLGLVLALCWLPAAARADDQAMLDRAIAGAVRQFDAARPGLGQQLFGVDVSRYGEALHQRRFSGGAWAGETRLALSIRTKPSGSCSRYAAFVRLPPEDGTLLMVLCPQFFTPGADALRVLTILHEMVHVVTGRGECQAMAFTARIEMLATGAFTPVDKYWRASKCASTEYRLP